MKTNGGLKGLAAATLIGVTAVSLSGCIAAIGGTDKSYPPSLGKQLIDLQSAHEKGAVTDEEYETAKADLLSRVDRK